MFHGWLAPLNWAHNEVAYHGGGAWRSEVTHLMAARKKKDKQGAGISKSLAGHRPSDLASFHGAPRLYLLKVPSPSISTVGYGATL